jgi:hypothetical protein
MVGRHCHSQVTRGPLRSDGRAGGTGASAVHRSSRVEPIARLSSRTANSLPAICGRLSATTALRAISGPEDDFWMVPMTVTSGLHWLPLRCPPFLVRCALPLNLVLRPRQVWEQLASEMDQDAARNPWWCCGPETWRGPATWPTSTLSWNVYAATPALATAVSRAWTGPFGEFVKAQAAAVGGREP